MKKILAIFSIAAMLWACGTDEPSGPGMDNGLDEPSVQELCNVRLNELDGSQDVVELYNAGDKEVSLKGFKIKKMRVRDGEDDGQTLWEGNAESIGPKAYMVLSYEKGELEHKFGSHVNTDIWLQDAEGNKLNEFVRGQKSIGWGLVNMQKSKDPKTEEPYSYSLVDGKWVYANPSLGKANGKKAGDVDQTMMTVAINEIDLASSTIELYNYGTTAVNLNGMQLRWSRIKEKTKEADNQTIWQGQKSAVMAPGSYYKVTSSRKLNGYNAANIHIKLRDYNNVDFTGEKLTWDDFKRGKRGSGWTLEKLPATEGAYVRVPDGIGLWYLGKASGGVTNGTDVSGGLVPDVDQEQPAAPKE